MTTKLEYAEIIEIYKHTVGTLEDTIKDLRKERGELQEQVFKLQDGLMSIRAPEAYRDHRMDSLELDETPEPEEATRRRELFAQASRDHLVNMEDSLFPGGAQELIDSLEGVATRKLEETESIHDNDES